MAKQRAPRSILITGASSGIGAALARHYAKPGVHLAITGRNQRRLANVAERLRDQGAIVEDTVMDVTDMAAMKAWILDLDAREPLDLVIANAGISGGPGLAGEDHGQIREIFSVNLAGVLNTVLPATLGMKQRERGQIGIVSSIAGFRGLPSAPAYSASKVAVRGWGEAIRGELAPDGVQVSVIMPGFVESRITDENAFSMPFLMSADKAAGIIARGLAKNKGRIAFPWPMALGGWVLNVMPQWLADRVLGQLPKKG